MTKFTKPNSSCKYQQYTDLLACFAYAAAHVLSELKT
uniref:Uncharacterized protein n=1 Tax=Arundo donax TaxID=35708 RepID=A0A0A8Y1E8_ARUDO